MAYTSFYISDSTAITAETVGNATLSQFELNVEHITLPFIENEQKANQVISQINQAYEKTGNRPFVFFTFVDKNLKALFENSCAICSDVLEPSTKTLSDSLNIEPTPKLHRTHAIKEHKYNARIEAMNFALNNDDGQAIQNYGEADVILVGVSRSGKTPTSIFLALQYGIKAANYPFTEDDMDNFKLPEVLEKHKKKLFGLTIEPTRLSVIRNERYANSKYASLQQCRFELRVVESMYKKKKLPFINTTHHSVEEISTKIMSKMGLERLYF